MLKRLAIVAATAALWASALVPASAQPPAPGAPQPTQRARVCDTDVTQPANQPPDGSAPVVFQIALCFEAQGGTSLVDYETYLYYIHLKPSQPSQGNWTRDDDAAEKVIHEDFLRLWGTGFLDNLWIERQPYIFSNGVVGQLITYHLEERQRIKIVDYVGSKALETSKINERLKDAMAEIRLDTFVDPALVKKVAGLVRDMLKEKGFLNAEVTPEIQLMAAGPKVIHLTFHMSEGPKVKIKKIVFTGNKNATSRTLKRKMEDNKELGLLSFITGHGTFQETKFDEDADRILAYYRELGYLRASVGAPEQMLLGDSSDRKTRYIELHVPITEGRRYRVGDVQIEGNTVVKTEFLKPLFGLKAGEYYNETLVRKGLEKSREVYGSVGYAEFTGFPDYKFHDDPQPGGEDIPQVLAAPPESLPAVVDVTVRLQEGRQYFVNRITFVGNSTTHDSVIRRNMNLLEGAVFDTNALKNSLRRINQLGYFKPLEEGKGVDVKFDRGDHVVP